MSKLTLRQFTDVVKALMEASLTKEYGIRLKIIEEPDEISDDGIQVTLKVERENIKECTKSGKMCETYSCNCNSNAYFFDMDESYHDYEERMDKGEEPESDILRDITDKMLKSISKEMEENPEPAKEKNNEREESICSDDMDSGSCSEDAILCAAPTGKASKRMKETTGEKAQTIHRTLEVKSEGAYGFKFGKNEKTPLEGDAIIIDESSMIDMELMASVLKAIPEGMKLILVGDIDQLPSVGCGNVLHEMIDSNVVPIVRLKTIFRQAAESQIIKNAHLINEGVVPSFKNNRNGDYFFMDVDGMEQERIRDYIVTYVCDNLPRYYNVGADEIQVLAPMKKGPTGVWKLNDYIQNRINPPSATKQIIPCNDHLLRVGDKVMYTCNDYDKKIFNGDVGKIVSICLTQNEADDADEDNADESAKRGFVVDFDGNRVHFDLSKAQDFILAYATTIHKSQGSEYDIVVMPLTTANYIMLQRNLLYTAVTRAKKVFVLFGQKNAVARAVKNLTVVNRNTRLGSRISEDAGFLLEKQNTKKHERKTA